MSAILEVRGLHTRFDTLDGVVRAVEGLSFELGRGETLGIVGESGCGKSVTALSILRLIPAETGRIAAGSIRFDGEELAGETPRAIIDRGMGYIPEDRHHEGIVPAFSVKENLVLKDVASPRFSWRSLLRLGEVDRNATALRERFDIRCSSTGAATGTLSGGNIQKVILARELARAPRALVAVYPTRGVDMGASEFIHGQLLALRGAGTGILLVSEELEELSALSDRIAVIYRGRILEVVAGREATRERLGRLMAGVEA